MDLLTVGISITIFCLGYFLGILQGGIKVYKNHNPNIEGKQEYNSSYLEEVPAEMKLFVEQNQGQYK